MRTCARLGLRRCPVIRVEGSGAACRRGASAALNGHDALDWRGGPGRPAVPLLAVLGRVIEPCSVLGSYATPGTSRGLEGCSMP